MKIRNVSSQDLKLSLEVNKQIKAVNLKPLQVMYCEDNSQVNRQLIVYEKKKLINIERLAEKPDYVEHYKSFFESGTYSVSKPSPVMDLDDEIEITEAIEIPEVEDSPFESDVVDQIDSDGPKQDSDESEKKKRGRPKKPVMETTATTEKKKRGRPKGSTKNKQS